MLGWLACMSLFFYGYWSPPYLALLLASIMMNFLFSSKLGADQPPERQHLWLSAAVTANLALLIYFKYLFPFLRFLHGHGVISHQFENIALPLGISFFTFTQIAYLIDLRQQIARRQGIIEYSFFVTFFPHLIAGPIIHPRELMSQLESPRPSGLRGDDFAVGLSWFVMGLAKKVLIADRLAPLADLIYDHPRSAGFLMTWLGALAYAMQLYFDFSGYSDMAVALARMFSIRFPLNFDSPYKAHGFIDFWTRWHMTLSRYLNEYLFTPAVLWINERRRSQGKRTSKKAASTPEGFFQIVFVPTMYTMVIAGVWHGAGTQFLIFGIL
jgi:alginate O-acetyltransferase complex protein AlgI